MERDAFAADLQSFAEEPLSDAEIEQHWQSFLDNVESVQAQQESLLRELVRPTA